MGHANAKYYISYLTSVKTEPLLLPTLLLGFIIFQSSDTASKAPTMTDASAEIFTPLSCLNNNNKKDLLALSQRSLPLTAG